MEENLDKRKAKPFLLSQVFFIGILWLADRIFFFFEQNFFNTYIDHVLELPELFISLMVALSATMGLIMNFMWGVISDNSRTKYGRRRPYFLFAVIAGTGMIMYAFGSVIFPDVIMAYIWCVIIDVIVIGITSNAVSVSQRAIIPDVIELEHRGRANGIVQAVSYVGLIIALTLFLLGDLLFGVEDPSGGTIIPQFGHLILLSLGGIIYAVCGIAGFFIIRERPASELPPKKKFGDQLRDSLNLGELKKQKNFFKILIAATVYQTGISTVMAFLFIYLFEYYNLIQLLLVILVGFTCLFPITLFLGRLADKYGRRRFMPLIITIIGISYILTYFVTWGGVINIILFIALIPIILVGLLGLDTIINAWAQDTLPKDTRGTFYGVFNIVYTISQVVGAFVGGFVAQFIDLPGIFIAAGIFFLISIPLFLLVKETLIKEE